MIRIRIGTMLLCILCVGCMDERNAGTAATDFDHVAEDALQAMQHHATEISATGAAVVAYIPGNATTRWSSRMLVVGTFTKDESNVLAFVYAKAAEMADTLKDSGSGVRPTKKGENGWKGGVIRKVANGYVLAAFSGAKSEDDVVISNAGADVMSNSFDGQKPGK